jgi:glycosyltransferase involved in cell wall biosynthesis
VVIGKIARLFRLKGHEDVVRGAEKIVVANPNVRFLFVGDGELAPKIREQIRAAGLDNYFRFTGLVPPERIPALVGAMDLLVHASLREGLARALVQALLAGKPVVSYDVDGAPEVVINDETGVLVPPRNIEELAAAVTRLAADPALREKLGARGRDRFTDQFRHERMTAQLRAMYERILGQDAVQPRRDSC